jgi:hypothetical protein
MPFPTCPKCGGKAIDVADDYDPNPRWSGGLPPPPIKWSAVMAHCSDGHEWVSFHSRGKWQPHGTRAPDLE